MAQETKALTGKRISVLGKGGSGKSTASYMREKLKEKGITLIGIIRRSPSIAPSWLKWLLLDATETKRDLEGTIGALEAAEEAYSAAP